MLKGARLPALALLLAALGSGWYLTSQRVAGPGAERLDAALQQEAPADSARAAYQDRSRGRVLHVEGVVERILPDDRDGSPHQRFIIRTTSGLSLLIAHNLDLAPRLSGLGPGETVSLQGEYEWNERGGVMHWTHDDPQGRHVAGYIDWRGQRYQ